MRNSAIYVESYFVQLYKNVWVRYLFIFKLTHPSINTLFSTRHATLTLSELAATLSKMKNFNCIKSIKVTWFIQVWWYLVFWYWQVSCVDCFVKLNCYMSCVKFRHCYIIPNSKFLLYREWTKGKIIVSVWDSPLSL